MIPQYKVTSVIAVLVIMKLFRFPYKDKMLIHFHQNMSVPQGNEKLSIFAHLQNIHEKSRTSKCGIFIIS